jgi:AcrR family transcriptional regulator
VAERAGVSVGSIYQYFPNKAAILFRLQTDEWHQTTTLLSSILNNRKDPPLARLRTLVHAFVRSECDEAAMRIALNDAAPLYRDAPEAAEAKAASDIAIQAFVEEVVPKASKQTQRTAAELLKTTLSAGGKDFSESPRTAAEIKVYSDAMADMFVAYLQSLGRKSKKA